MFRTTHRRAARVAAATALVAATVTTVAFPAAATPIRAHQTYGADRYLTSLVLEDGAFDTAFLVTGKDFPDGLSAAAVAGAWGANVYLSPQGQVTPEIRQRLGYYRNIVVIGSENALSADVWTWLQQNTRADLHRVAGADRYGTAAALATWAYPHGAADVIVATGTNYADALSGGAAGAKIDAPVLLVGKDGVPAETAAALKALNPGRITVLGSESTVSRSVFDNLTALAPQGATVQRLAGADRYATSVAVAKAFFTAADTQRAVMVSGSSWPDGVTGGAYAGRRGAPLLLTPATCVPQAVNLEIEALGVQSLDAVGGPSVLSEAARKRTSCEAGPKTYLDELAAPTGNARFLSDHATIGGVFYPRSASYDTDPRNSEYRTWALTGKYSRFTATVGLDDGNVSGLRSTIDVYGDEKLLASVAVAQGAPAAIDVDVTGVQNLKVVSTSSARSALQSTDNVVHLGDAAVR